MHVHLIPRAVDYDIRGIDLIYQATQQVVKSKIAVTIEEMNLLIEKLRTQLKSNFAIS